MINYKRAHNLAMYFKQSTILLITFVAGATNCTPKPDPNAGSTDSSVVQETVHPASSKQLLADTVTLHIANGSLSPDYQFSKEWVLTEKEAVYRETVGEEPERISRKKMYPQFWDLVRRFDKSMTYDPPERLEGADEAYLIFYVSGKAYRFPFLEMEGRAASIQDFFEPN